MNKDQETRSESDFGNDQTGSGVNVSVGVPVNCTKSKLGLILKELREINTTLSKLETGQSNLETKVETGLNVLDTKVTAWFSNL